MLGKISAISMADICHECIRNKNKSPTYIDTYRLACNLLLYRYVTYIIHYSVLVL